MRYIVLAVLTCMLWSCATPYRPWPIEPRREPHPVDRTYHSPRSDGSGQAGFYNGGIDIIADAGAEVYTVAQGWIEFEHRGASRTLVIKEPDGSMWGYRGLAPDSIPREIRAAARADVLIPEGVNIGRVGGMAEGPLLHLAFRDPEGYICDPLRELIPGKDTIPPVIHDVLIYPDGGTIPFPRGADDVVAVSGRVDIGVHAVDGSENVRAVGPPTRFTYQLVPAGGEPALDPTVVPASPGPPGPDEGPEGVLGPRTAAPFERLPVPRERGEGFSRRPDHAFDAIYRPASPPGLDEAFFLLVTNVSAAGGIDPEGALDTTLLEPGQYFLVVTASDRAGNKESTWVHVRVDPGVAPPEPPREEVAQPTKPRPTVGPPVPPGSVFQPPVDRPVAVLPEESVDLGTCHLGDTARRSFRIRNLGTRALKLSDVTASGCVLSRYDEEILPGGSGEIAVRMDASEVGEIRCEVVAATNDPNRPELRLPLGGRTIRFLRFSDPAPSFYIIRGTGAAPPAVEVSGPPGEAFRPIGAEDLDGRIQCRLAEVEPGSRYRLVLTPDLYGTPSTYESRIRVGYRHGDEDHVVLLPVKVGVDDEIAMEPTFLAFRRDERIGSFGRIWKPKDARIWSRSGKPFTIIETRKTAQYLHVERIASGDRSEYRIQVQPVRSPPTAEWCDITTVYFRTDREDHPDLGIEVFVEK